MKNYLYKKMSEIDEKYITEAMTAPEKSKKHIGFKRAMLLCATLALAIGALAVMPLLFRDDAPDLPGYDFTSPEFADFEMDGTTLVAYKGGETENLVIPEGVEAIADFAFASSTGANKIKNISLSSTVKSLGSNAFAGCDSLMSFELNENNSEFVRQGDLLMSSSGEMIIKYIGDENIKSYTIPSGVKYIAAHAFQLTELEHVTFPEGLLYIGYYAFAGLYKLSEIHLPDSMLELGEGAFAGCYRAYEGSYPEEMVIGERALSQTGFYMRQVNGGVPTPQEDIYRYGISITESFKKSNGELITDQLMQILEYYRSGKIQDKTFCYAALYDAPELPEGSVIPDDDSIDFTSLQIVEKDWLSDCPAEVILPIEGDYDIAVGYFLYGVWDYQTWDEVKWRAQSIRFIPKDAAKNADLTIGDWFIEFSFDKEKNWYDSITFSNLDGRNITEKLHVSRERYRLTISPDGEHFIVEYNVDSKWNFFIEDLTGRLHEGGMSYKTTSVPYFSRADGDYIPFTAYWNTDTETMEQWPVIAENVQGTFMMNFNLDQQVIRNNTYSGEDTYCDYDLVYIEGKKEPAVVYGSETHAVPVCHEDNTSGKAIRKVFVYDFPTDWDSYGSDLARQSRSQYPIMRFGYSLGYKYLDNAGADTELSYEYMQNYKNVYGFFKRTFNEGGGENGYIKKYSYTYKTDVVNDVVVCTTFYVNALTADGNMIPLYFYSYEDSDGNALNYFDQVIVPIIESIRPAETLEVTNLTATDPSKGVFNVEFLNEKGEKMIGEWEMGTIFYEDKVQNLDAMTVAQHWADDYVKYLSVAFEDGKYYLSIGNLGPGAAVLENGAWEPLSK